MGTGKIILKNIKNGVKNLCGGIFFFFLFLFPVFFLIKRLFKFLMKKIRQKKQAEMLCKNDINYTNINQLKSQMRITDCKKKKRKHQKCWVWNVTEIRYNDCKWVAHWLITGARCLITTFSRKMTAVFPLQTCSYKVHSLSLIGGGNKKLNTSVVSFVK